jgi:hypothetical protein
MFLIDALENSRFAIAAIQWDRNHLYFACQEGGLMFFHKQTKRGHLVPIHFVNEEILMDCGWKPIGPKPIREKI